MAWVLLITLCVSCNIPELYITKTSEDCLKLRDEMFQEYKVAQGWLDHIELKDKPRYFICKRAHVL